MRYTLYVADSVAANETHTMWFLILLKAPVAVLLFMLLTS